MNKAIANNDIYLLLIRAAMGQSLDQQERVLLQNYLARSQKS